MSLWTPNQPADYCSAQGGSFNFNASVVNHGPLVGPFSVWARIKNPTGVLPPILHPLWDAVTINPPLNVTIIRWRTQNIPNLWIAGVYTYLGYANWTFAYPAVDSSWFHVHEIKYIRW